jgi:hypothetical protein
MTACTAAIPLREADGDGVDVLVADGTVPLGAAQPAELSATMIKAAALANVTTTDRRCCSLAALGVACISSMSSSLHQSPGVGRPGRVRHHVRWRTCMRHARVDPAGKRALHMLLEGERASTA